MADGPDTARLRLAIFGVVQGVGFRPFVHGLARRIRLSGWVRNVGGGVVVEAEGERRLLAELEALIRDGAPAHALILGMEASWLKSQGGRGFHIVESEADEGAPPLVLPDLATCPECLREVLDPTERRFRYPFTNCTRCGPRFSIIEAVPYDRLRTTMKAFRMCADCRREFRDPVDRRHHAQPIACSRCGPRLSLTTAEGAVLAEEDDALRETVRALRAGRVVAVKGLGGYQLVARLGDRPTVERLRLAKRRGPKPFATMFPDISSVEKVCRVAATEHASLESSAAPIVLLARKRRGVGSAEHAAPGNPLLGVMLPTTPLHHLLLRDLGEPVVATSGNLADEPICIDDNEARRRLAGLAELFLAHDRAIIRHVDDSIVRVVAGREMVLRRARGFAPLPVLLPRPLPVPVMAHGADLKNAVAVGRGNLVMLGQHVGDLEHAPALEAHRAAVRDLPRLHQVHPAARAVDLHPGYHSSRIGEEAGGVVVRVQHHFAHALACLAENAVKPPALAVTWDGTGYGTDGTIWGGEFLIVEGDGYRRFAHLRPFPLTGGDAASREPRRAALGVLAAMGAQTVGPTVEAFSPEEHGPLVKAMQRGVNTAMTTSVGRLFDAVASLLGLRHQSRFEAEAAMELEWLAADARHDGKGHGMVLREGEHPGTALVVDWEPCLHDLLDERVRGVSAGVLSARFHQALVDCIVEVAQRAGLRDVLLTGGCFQNAWLLQGAAEALRRDGRVAHWPQRVPPNDGGIALGQVLAAAPALG